jgi:hypothetical protein
MAKVCIVFGVVLCLLGVGGWLGTGRTSVTALIPAFLGLPLAVLGALALDERRLKMAMHTAVLLALAGLVGSARGLPGFLTLVRGGEVERPAAVVLQTVTAVLCAAFVALSIKSFVDVRRARADQPT